MDVVRKVGRSERLKGKKIKEMIVKDHVWVAGKP